MAYVALYRKYRPSSLENICGQEKIVNILHNAIITNKVSHAYLFSGPRGTGKTSTAKILAKIVNCENLENGVACEKCNSCLNILNSSDVVEIDAASNNGVDEIRELRDKINLVPTSSKYKVYIIDEVHMLTSQAFNALLKTLEEPPSHAIFILATTELNKIPMTILSRCQKLQFYKISDSYIIQRLKYISSQENIDIDDDALYEIARLADGGMRDAINILDQLTAYKNGKIELEDVYKINGIVSYVEIEKMLRNIKNNDSSSIIEFIYNVDKNGKSIAKFIEELIMFLEDMLLYKNTNKLTDMPDKNEKIKNLCDIYDEMQIYDFILNLNDTLINIKNSNYPVILFTICILKYMKKIINTNVKNDDNSSKNINELENNDFSNKSNKELIEDLKKEKNVEIDKNNDKNISREIKLYENNTLSDNLKYIRINNTLATASKANLLNIKDKWNEIKNYITDSKYAVVAGLLNDADVVAVGENNMIVTSKMTSIVQRINDNITEVEKLIKNIYNHKYLVVALLDNEWLEEKQKYIEKKSQGYEYKLIDEVSNELKNSTDNEISPVDQLMDLLGEELIEYR